jgi:hypothetical protein
VSHIDPGERARMKAYRERKAARTARLRERRAAETREAQHEEWEGTLGKALAESLIRYLGVCKPERRMPIERAMAMIGYSEELKRLLVRSIETSPALEESFLLIAELAYRDGADSVEPSYDNYYEEIE